MGARGLPRVAQGLTVTPPLQGRQSSPSSTDTGGVARCSRANQMRGRASLVVGTGRWPKLSSLWGDSGIICPQVHAHVVGFRLSLRSSSRNHSMLADLG